MNLNQRPHTYSKILGVTEWVVLLIETLAGRKFWGDKLPQGEGNFGLIFVRVSIISMNYLINILPSKVWFRGYELYNSGNHQRFYAGKLVSKKYICWNLNNLEIFILLIKIYFPLPVLWKINDARSKRIYHLSGPKNFFDNNASSAQYYANQGLHRKLSVVRFNMETLSLTQDPLVVDIVKDIAKVKLKLNVIWA